MITNKALLWMLSILFTWLVATWSMPSPLWFGLTACVVGILLRRAYWDYCFWQQERMYQYPMNFNR